MTCTLHSYPCTHAHNALITQTSSQNMISPCRPHLSCYLRSTANAKPTISGLQHRRREEWSTTGTCQPWSILFRHSHWSMCCGGTHVRECVFTGERVLRKRILSPWRCSTGAKRTKLVVVDRRLCTTVARRNITRPDLLLHILRLLIWGKGWR